MAGEVVCDAQAFWNKAKGAGWSDETTRARARQERGVVQIGGHYMFPDGSSLRDTFDELGRKLIVQQRNRT
ncbi:MAG: hypothetical protein HYX27_11725 [Acidobacteria bacterium]|nr:hypothetical protein [Acidobacteriota bacterium]